MLPLPILLILTSGVLPIESELSEKSVAMLKSFANVREGDLNFSVYRSVPVGISFLCDIVISGCYSTL
jgi:hypothetical protein